MKKIKIHYILLLSIFAIGISSCEKLLDKEPTDKLSLEDLFKDVSGSKTALAGAYKELNEAEHYQKNTMIYPDIMAGNIKFSKTTNLLFDDVFGFVQTAQESSMNDTYSHLYSELNNVNNIIKYTPTAQGSAIEKAKIIAEAKCLRALLHFDLVRVFSQPVNFTATGSHLGIPLILQPQLFADPAPKRSTVAESYAAIVADLTDALLAFDENNTGVLTGGTKQNYFTKRSAQALLAKIYLYQRNWDKAFELSDLVIKSNQYTLLTESAYVASWTGRTPSSESIFEIALEPTFSGNSLGSYYDITNTMFRMYAATNDLLTLYSSTDVRRSSSMFNPLTLLGTNYFFTKKYASSSTAATPVKVLRLSELYLIRAEAAAEKSSPDFVLANSDLNIIRKRADASAVNLNITIKSDLLDAILLERRKELAFEGNLLFDLLRHKKDITRVDVTAQTKNLPANDSKLVMPFPANTINANINMIQNPGY